MTAGHELTPGRRSVPRERRGSAKAGGESDPKRPGKTQASSQLGSTAGENRSLQRWEMPFKVSLAQERGKRHLFLLRGGGVGGMSSFPYNFPSPKIPDFSWEKLLDK